MKTIFLLIAMSASASGFAQEDISKVQWLAGTWTRTNSKPGRSGLEVWRKTGDAEMTGKGISLKGTDTTFIEKLKIVSKDGKLFYVADVPENKSQTWFAFTSITDKGFVCEDPKHDFPKKIVYELDGSNLKATISGNGREIAYLFIRTN